MTWWMMKRSLFASIVFGASVCLVSAQDAKVSVDMIGIGSMSCAHWRSTEEHLLEGTVWTHGFWTGLNYVAAASGQTQPKISMSSIVAEVEKGMRSESIPDFSQRRMDDVSGGQEVGTRLSGVSSAQVRWEDPAGIRGFSDCLEG
jgi:hypothetical protein